MTEEKTTDSKNLTSKKQTVSIFSGDENEFLKRCRNMGELVYNSNQKSVQEGFEYFASSEGKEKLKKMRKKSIVKSVKEEGKISGRMKTMKSMASIGLKLQKGMKESYGDIEIYLNDLEQNSNYTTKSNPNSSSYLESYPNLPLWEEMFAYTSKTFDIIKIGFTELPQDLIFKNKCVLFRYVLVFMMEMKKDKIDQAPKFAAGQETMRVYAELGLAVNNMANWLRSKGIRAQSNHPLGGLVCTPPLAGMAGLGGQGAQGVLITQEFGPRQRLAPIFIEEKLFEFTDSTEHFWIEKYCAICGRCIKKCPTGAIYESKRVNIPDIPKIGAMKTCVSREKCFPYFTETMGCSICIAVCPFSDGQDTYSKLKRKFS